MAVDDIHKACARFEQLNVKFIKRLQDGKMKHIAFIADPDDYWVEVRKKERSVIHGGHLSHMLLPEYRSFKTQSSLTKLPSKSNKKVYLPCSKGCGLMERYEMVEVIGFDKNRTMCRTNPNNLFI